MPVTAVWDSGNTDLKKKSENWRELRYQNGARENWLEKKFP